MSILDRALRLGEGKQFKQYAKRVDRINAWEPELELLDDDELRKNADALRERARNGESLTPGPYLAVVSPMTSSFSPQPARTPAVSSAESHSLVLPI